MLTQLLLTGKTLKNGPFNETQLRIKSFLGIDINGPLDGSVCFRTAIDKKCDIKLTHLKDRPLLLCKRGTQIFLRPPGDLVTSRLLDPRGSRPRLAMLAFRAVGTQTRIWLRLSSPNATPSSGCCCPKTPN